MARSSARRRTAPVAALLAIVAVLASVVPAAAAGPDLRPADAAAPEGRLIVLWRDDAPATVGRLHVDGVRRIEAASGAAQRSLVVARGGQAAVVAAELRRDPRVLAVVPDARIVPLDWPASGPPSDPRYGEQEDLPQIGVPSVWPTTTGDPDLVIAVIDTGVDLDHPDLAGVPIVAPRNENWNNTDVHDGIGHGTHVAGTIVARTDNAIGIAGIAPGVTLMPIKVFEDDGFGTIFDLLDAVDWARTHGADIVNLSLGTTLSRAQVALMQPTFTLARDAGILLVGASGNSGARIMEYPAGLNGVVSVGAVDRRDRIADFSTFNRAVDLTAPGVDTLSTIDGGYERIEGTSMASPHVAAVAALIWSARPELSVDELEAVLRASAVDLGDSGRDDLYGSGRIDAAAALAAPVPDPLPDLEPAPGPAGEFKVRFTSPATATRQTSHRVNVVWTASHEPTDGVLVRVAWRLRDGQCPGTRRPADDYRFLPFVSPYLDTGLHVGSCYRWDILAIDEDGEIVEATSKPVSVVDVVRPTVRGRHPAPGERRVAPGANLRIGFSEGVQGISHATVRLRNLDTGLLVATRLTYDRHRHRVTIDPVRRMFGRTRYAVELTGGIHDSSGNRLKATAWTFRTGR